MSERQPRYLSIERPDESATVDFLSFHPIPAVKVDGATVRVSLTYDDKNGARLSIFAQDAGTADILCDESFPLSITELDKTEMDEMTADETT